jgi:hypothetical protein
MVKSNKQFQVMEAFSNHLLNTLLTYTTESPGLEVPKIIFDRLYIYSNYLVKKPNSSSLKHEYLLLNR